MICLTCQYRGPIPNDGSCMCLHGKGNPVDITVRWASGVCPAGYFENPPASSHKPYVAPDPLPYTEWPLSVRIFSKLRRIGESGIGDTVKSQLSVGGSDVIGWLIAAAGIECGCTERQKWLNTRFPY